MHGLTFESTYDVPARARTRPQRWWQGWGVLEWFIVVQYLSTALFFLPGAQSVRMLLRTMPYLLAGALFFLVRGRRDTRELPPGASLVAATLVMMAVLMLRPDSQPLAGLAQVMLQACIAAPLFWVARLIKTPRDFERMMAVVLACNAVHAGVGLLQVYAPETFLPTEFNRAAISMDSKLLQSLSYVAADGRRIVRPPGLSDMPGGAASGGTLCALFGIAVATRVGASLFRQIAGVLLAAMGFSVLYFSHVRSVVIMTIIALLAFAFLSARQGRPAAALYTIVAGTLVVLGGFFFAVAVGGEAVQDRFSTITERGVVESYQAERGNFMMYTLREVLPQYPFGAGVGRWGVMNLYFGDPNKLNSKGLYAEIQMTGWIYDGGIFLLLFYGTAVLLALRFAFRVAQRRLPGDLGSYAPLVFCAMLLIAGMTLAGPSFNTQLGIQYWTLTAALHAAVQRLRSSDPPPVGVSRGPGSS